MKTNLYEFPAEYLTELYINGNNQITIRQVDHDLNDPECIIVIQTKKRALAIARALRELAAVATFELDEEEQ